MPSACCVAVALTCCLMFARADILEDWIYPLEADVFFAGTFGKQWSHFPHNKSLVPITLEHVADWLESQGRDEEVIETLPHPVTRKAFRSDNPSPVQYIQEAFLQGHSMVINSLNRWSEPGTRVAKDLNAAADLPADVYMYLTPPHSQSYGMHSDVMDAFMVQLGGSKSWKVCDVTSWMAPGERYDQLPLKLNGTCEEVLMQQGDVMYLPYGTLHQASTSSDYSMHLTVNIERQYYVWLALIFAMIHKVAKPDLTIEAFLASNEFAPDDLENDLYRLMLTVSSSLPLMHRLPGGPGQVGRSSRLLLTPLCNEDLPAEYLPSVKSQLKELLTSLLTILPEHGPMEVLLDGRRMPMLKLVKQLQKKSEDLLPWALQLARVHSIKHAGLQLQKPHLFESLSSARKLHHELFTRAKLDDFPAKISGKASFVRRSALRAVLLDDVIPARLIMNNQVLPVTPQQLSAVRYCLGLYSELSAQGRPFRLMEVERLGQSAIQLLHQLILSGAVEVIA